MLQENIIEKQVHCPSKLVVEIEGYFFVDDHMERRYRGDPPYKANI
jgi:hypothetical protein